MSDTTTKMLVFAVLVLVVALGGLLFYATSIQQSDEGAQAAANERKSADDLCKIGDCETVTVDYVIDGDTLEVIAESGEVQRVRVLGVDTPETVKSDAPVGCMGPEASSATAALAGAGTTVTLVTDPAADAVDNYGRRLSHIITADGTNLGAELLERGLATTTSFPHTLTDTYAATESAAMDNAAGLWGHC